MDKFKIGLNYRLDEKTASCTIKKLDSYVVSFPKLLIMTWAVILVFSLVPALI